MNKRNILKTLVFASVLSFSLAGCNGSGGNGNVAILDDDHIHIDDHNVVTTGYEDVHVHDDVTYFKGVHDFTYTKSGKAFIRDGVTKFKLVFPQESSNIISLAKDEFTHFFKIATDIEIPSIPDKNLSFDKNSTYISIGKTKLLETSGIDIDYGGLTNDGCRIITKNNTIFIVGGSDYGTLNAVYDFLHLYFRYEQYSPDVYEIDKNVKDLVLYNFNVTDIPDIPHRAQNYGFLIPGAGDYDQSNFGYRMRANKSRGFYFMPVHREIGNYSSPAVLSTNTNTYVPFDVYAGEHPKWFSDLSTAKDPQICYTAHGDSEEYEKLVELVFAKITNSLVHYTPDKYPNMNVMTFTMEDNFNICNCEHCKEYEAKYGAISSTLITFVNKVARRVAAWQKLEENKFCYRENFQIIYFAYNGFVDAPVTITGSGENAAYTPSYPEVVLEKNTGAYLAIIDRGDFQFSLFDNPIHNAGVNGQMGIKETIDSWGCLTDSTYLWLYQTNFSNYPYFYDSFSFYSQPMYNYISSKGLKMFFAQGQDTSASGSTGTNFNNLKAYLNFKLSWDSTLDESTLILRYFKAMYGKAYKEMLNYFGLLRGFYQKVLEDNYGTLVNNRSIYNGIARREYFSLYGLNSLIKEIDKAQSVILNSNHTQEEKRIYKYNIEADALFPLYAKLALYGGIELTNQECVDLAHRLLDDISALRLDGMKTRESGGADISSLPNSYL